MNLARLSAIFFVLSVFHSCVSAQTELPRWQQQAKNVTIIRDNYGIPHIYGKTDADCVFGLMYAQCEDDFGRVEDNYLTNLGRRSEAYGESSIYEDLLIRMTIDSTEAVEDYKKAPDWLKKLLQAYADGINFYLYKHPDVKPLAIKTFKPWYPLMYTDGSISALQTGGLTERDLKEFYDSKPIVSVLSQHGDEKLIGSNGIAIAPNKSATGKALFYINPHVTFYFRPEVHMQSEEGLNVYGAVTWGQFFVYQGFNEFCGFMHTSSSADAADLYAETIIKNKNDKYEYKYNDVMKPVTEKKVDISYTDNGTIKTKTFTAYSTHHGPILGLMDGKWLSLKTRNRSLNGLMQSWQRTKSKSLADFTKTLDYRANLSNNTVYADRDGNIAYWHGNFMPRRDTSFNWGLPVDGSIGKTEWKGMHTLNEIVHEINPRNGWVQNSNNTPFSVSGPESPKRENYPAYMAPDFENFRGLNLVRLLSARDKYSMDDLIAVGYDPHLTAFDSSLPVLFASHEKIRTSNPDLFAQTKEQIEVLQAWDRNSSANSVAVTLAIHWAEKMNRIFTEEDPEWQIDFTKSYGPALRKSDPTKMIQALKEVSDLIAANFGTWKTAWGEVNRMQRISNGPKARFDDAAASIPVGRVSSQWGMLPSLNSRYYGTKKRYAYGGNSFVCAVEFGDKIRARSILAGGNSGDPASAHFFDQSKMYAEGQFKDVLFYKEDVLKHVERLYHPGE
jgi:acyl-homoserine lactone acylase PvdQ